jgi:hypothetical protein
MTRGNVECLLRVSESDKLGRAALALVALVDQGLGGRNR